MKVVKKNYSNIVQLLKNRGFIDLVRVARDGKEYVFADHGPPGTLLRQNILKQWWEIMVQGQSNVFPVERPVFHTKTDQEQENERPTSKTVVKCRETLQQDCVSKYVDVLKLTNGRLPLSVVSVGACLAWREMQNNEPEEKALLFGSSSVTRLMLQNYTAPSGTSIVFDHWLQLRLSWWKKFSRNPSKFSVTSSSSSSTNNQNADISAGNSDVSRLNGCPQQSVRIMYQFPWGPEIIEEVSNLGDKQIARLQEEGDQSYKGRTAGNKSCLPHCIECSSSLESAMAVWLIDSFDERRTLSFTKKHKQESSRTCMVLQLHPQIAPYQAAIVVSLPPSTSSASVTSSLPSVEMLLFCDRLEKDLQKAGICVFNTSQHGGTFDAHLKRNDQLGIPYTIIMSESTLADGVVNTRNRDTSNQTTSHISTLIEDLGEQLGKSWTKSPEHQNTSSGNGTKKTEAALLSETSAVTK